jgi:hypothetical protein
MKEQGRRVLAQLSTGFMPLWQFEDDRLVVLVPMDIVDIVRAWTLRPIRLQPYDQTQKQVRAIPTQPLKSMSLWQFKTTRSW